jgi:hypothetical protein
VLRDALSVHLSTVTLPTDSTSSTRITLRFGDESAAVEFTL